MTALPYRNKSESMQEWQKKNACLYLTITRIEHVFVFFSALKTIYVFESLLFVGLFTFMVQYAFHYFFGCVYIILL